VTVLDLPELDALAESADRFLGAVRALADDDVLQASALPGWTRAHLLTHVDLAAGYGPDDWPAEFVATELRRVTALMDHRADAPPVTLIAASAVRVGTVPPVDVTGPPAAILAWLSGRGDGSGLDAGGAGLPSLPPLA